MPTAKDAKAQAGEPLECISYRLRRAARMAAKHYDDALRPVGLRNTQFTILNALAYLGHIGIGELAVELATDGTTLTRNLDVLVRRGFVENMPDEDGRVRRMGLTDAGRTVLDEGLPLWREAQEKVLAALDPESWDTTRGVLSHIEIVTQSG